MTRITSVHGPLIVLIAMAAFTVSILAYIAIDAINIEAQDHAVPGAEQALAVLPFAPAYASHASSHTGIEHVMCNYIDPSCEFFDITLDSARVIISAHTWTAPHTDRNYMNHHELADFGDKVYVSVESGTLTSQAFVRLMIAASQTHYHKQYQVSEILLDLASMKQTIQAMQAHSDNLQAEIDTMERVLGSYRCPQLRTVSPC